METSHSGRTPLQGSRYSSFKHSYVCIAGSIMAERRPPSLPPVMHNVIRQSCNCHVTRKIVLHRGCFCVKDNERRPSNYQQLFAALLGPFFVFYLGGNLSKPCY